MSLKKKLLIRKGCISSGPHFNPENRTHGNFQKLKLGLLHLYIKYPNIKGDISAKTRHVGDYGNVISNNNGVINVTFTDTVSKL